jgi:alkanesulfonate monooxygenase SsuD/methylene tetrahydromethanopterin reductase-like flavin-dependent oxidoreductase (luciferase family)
MFVVALAFVTWHLAPPGVSLAGKLAGGLFVYTLSLPETYRLARLRWVASRAASIS